MRSAFTDFVPMFVVTAALCYFLLDFPLYLSLSGAVAGSIAVALALPMIRRRLGPPTERDR